MTPDVHQHVQRSRTNLYRFRRLKWGDPPSRFKAANVLRGKPVPQQLSTEETPQDGPVVHLDLAKRKWSPIDVALLVCIAVSLVVIAATVMG